MSETNVTTVSEFEHTALKAGVAIVGNQHTGSEAYMDSLRTQLDIYQTRGSVFHYENLQPSPPQELACESAAVQKAYADIDYLLDIDKGSSLSSVYDLVPTAHASWVSYDMTALELAKYIDARPDQRMALKTFTNFMRQSKDEPTKLREKLYDTVAGSFALVAFTALNRSAITARNTVALGAVADSLTRAPDQDITLLWGQAHVKGIAKGLARQGFRLTNINYLHP
jgi:hypothetical protein